MAEKYFPSCHHAFSKDAFSSKNTRPTNPNIRRVDAFLGLSVQMIAEVKKCPYITRAVDQSIPSKGASTLTMKYLLPGPPRSAAANPDCINHNITPKHPCA